MNVIVRMSCYIRVSRKARIYWVKSKYEEKVGVSRDVLCKLKATMLLKIKGTKNWWPKITPILREKSSITCTKQMIY